MMKLELLNPTHWAIIIATLSFLWSIFNYIIGKIVHGKLTNNDLKHLTEDVKKLDIKHSNDMKEIIDKTGKSYEEIKDEQHQIFLAVRRLERKQSAHLAVCNERHKKDNKSTEEN